MLSRNAASTVIRREGIENPAQGPMIETSKGRGRCSVPAMLAPMFTTTRPTATDTNR
jgi:hypothetical protein